MDTMHILPIHYGIMTSALQEWGGNLYDFVQASSKLCDREFDTKVFLY
jgi:hypothetical protein